MTYTERIQNVAILGAAGKMGSGITLLTVLEMADEALKPENAGKVFFLYAIDTNEEALAGLMKYLKSQVQKSAEKKAVALRNVYTLRDDLVENADIINEYVGFVTGLVKPVTRIENAAGATLVFEAASENPELKIRLFKTIESVNPNLPWYLTNTSSIPISYLEEKSGITGRMAGFHFYNPPAVQKLVEIIYSPGVRPDLKDFTLHFARNLRKTVVFSNDMAGFIGNGHFMRDILYATQLTEKLQSQMPMSHAIALVNRISQELLVRPMGIFQLIDYVGVDVCRYIMQVMAPYYPGEQLHSPLLDHFFGMGIKGGQNPDGSQKNGIIEYEKGKPWGVFDPAKKSYVRLESMTPELNDWIGQTSDIPQWKDLVKSQEREERLARHFSMLKQSESKGSQLAVEYGQASLSIGKKLVTDGVASNENDVNTVLMTGFFHLYGPVNKYFND
jgi:3-hydroxyacyl-CoA dehydrogenase